MKRSKVIEYVFYSEISDQLYVTVGGVLLGVHTPAFIYIGEL